MKKVKRHAKRCLYKYILSNGEDYWTYFNENQMVHIGNKFNRKKSNIIQYKDITIERVPIQKEVQNDL